MNKKTTKKQCKHKFIPVGIVKRELSSLAVIVCEKCGKFKEYRL